MTELTRLAGATLLIAGIICLIFGSVTSLMGSRDMGPNAALFGVVLTVTGWAILAVVS